MGDAVYAFRLTLCWNRLGLESTELRSMPNTFHSKCDHVAFLPNCFTSYKFLITVTCLSVARELESHISSFAARVEGRRQILESAVLFYSHVEEVKHR
jgi:hypothetical protein